MKTYTYSEARQKLASLLDRSRRDGRVLIRRKDGQLFILQPARPEGSPLDVPGVTAGLRQGESLDWLRASRENSANRLLDRRSYDENGGSSDGRGGMTDKRDSISLNAADDALMSLERVEESLERVEQNAREWKWAIIFLHNALQGLMVCAVKDSAGVLHQNYEIAEKMVAYLEKRTERPPEKLDSFLGLYKKIKSNDMLRHVTSKKFTPTGTQGKSIKTLNRIRNDFIHFVHDLYSLDTGILPRIFIDCLEMADYLVKESGNFFWNEEGQSIRYESTLSGIKLLLKRRAEQTGNR